jgi:tetratricopeptide (TPR) repeat protein
MWAFTSVALALSAGVAHAETPRATWIGLVRGPLAPSAAAEIEQVLLDEIGAAGRVVLLDAAGHPLGPKAKAEEAARFRLLLDEGVEHLLNLRYERALERLEQAILLFETHLTALEDHDALHDALLAKAEGLAERGDQETALTTLRRLAALKPVRKPNTKSHKRAFVALWQKAQRSLGKPGRIEITVDLPGAQIQLDGRPIGEAPLTSPPVLPGTHYLAARWPEYTVLLDVQVSPGATVEARLQRAGPAERLRAEVISAIERRAGAEQVAATAGKVTAVSTARRTLSAVVRPDGDGTALFLADHQEGQLRSITAVALAGLDAGQRALALRRLVAHGLAGETQGGWVLAEAGPPKPAPDLDALAFGAPGTSRATVAALAAGPSRVARPEVVPTEELGLAPPPPADAEAPAITTRWWFWALIGAAAVGGASAALILTRPDPTTTTVELILPAGGR